MNNIPLVSVCIPVYNQERLLRRCIDSVAQQTLTHIEIILVNDGSTDSSGALIANYCTTDTRIRCLSKESNEGSSMARKDAVRQSSGKYIGFVDSDDWIAPEMMEKLYNEAERIQADIVVCNYSEECNSFRSKKKTLQLSPSSFKEHSSFNIFPGDVSPSCCNKLFRRELFFENNIFFPPYNYAEDMVMVAQLYFYARRIGVVEESLYYYDTSQQEEKRKSRLVAHLQDEIKAVQYLFDFFVPRNHLRELRTFLKSRKFVLLSYALNIIRSEDAVAKDLFRRLIGHYYNSLPYIRSEYFFLIARLYSLLEFFLSPVITRKITKDLRTLFK